MHVERRENKAKQAEQPRQAGRATRGAEAGRPRGGRCLTGDGRLLSFYAS